MMDRGLAVRRVSKHAVMRATRRFVCNACGAALVQYNGAYCQRCAGTTALICGEEE